MGKILNLRKLIPLAMFFVIEFSLAIVSYEYFINH